MSGSVMLIRMRDEVGRGQIDRVCRILFATGHKPKVVGRTVVLGGKPTLHRGLSLLPGVESVEHISTSYKLVNRAVRPEGTRVRIGQFEVGGPEFVVAAGPCAVETEQQVTDTARQVAKGGARLLRGGAFKPRTSPYSFQGLGEKGLQLLSQAGRKVGLPTVTEVIAPDDVSLVACHADVLQVGARNMQNYSLLNAVGATDKPVLLKRGLSATIEELLLAAEYIALQGNLNVILCERGIRTFETATRNTLDLASVALLRQLTHLPILVDPSHGSGHRELIGPLSKAAVAVGADGLIIEVHNEPESALCDGAQSITPCLFQRIMHDLAPMLAMQGRHLNGCPDTIPAHEQIESCRNKIDNLDSTLLRLLSERVRTGVRIGKLKRRLHQPLHSPDREAEVVNRLLKAKSGLDRSVVERLFNEIISATVSEQQRQVGPAAREPYAVS